MNKRKMQKPLKILQIGDKHLISRSSQVSDSQRESQEFQQLIDQMIATCEHDKDKTAGLAAPQIGKNYRLTIVRRVDLEEAAEEVGEKRSENLAQNPEKTLDLWQEMINPSIISKPSDRESMIWEACLSIGVGEKQLWGPVWRDEIVVVEFEDRTGKVQKLEADGFFSHLIQHEIDHLDGILFTQHVKTPDKNLWLAKDFDKYIETHGKYPPMR